MESVDSLANAIDRHQLTADLNGTFQYNHLRWLEFRLVRIFNLFTDFYSDIFLLEIRDICL